MGKFIETGHAKNVANFEDLISFVTGYGSAYNPSKNAIKLSALSTKRTDALASLTTVNTALIPWTKAIDARQAIFDPLSKLITKVQNAFIASDVTPADIEDVKAFVRKLQGRRATAITPDSDPTNPNAHVSASQMSFDSRIESMSKLILILTATANYNPSETELKVSNLTSILNAMKSTNTAVIAANTTLSNARISRNDILYHPTTGLVRLSADVKTYVKSLYGPQSAQYRQISGLEFNFIKN